MSKKNLIKTEVSDIEAGNLYEKVRGILDSAREFYENDTIGGNRLTDWSASVPACNERRARKSVYDEIKLNVCKGFCIAKKQRRIASGDACAPVIASAKCSKKRENPTIGILLCADKNDAVVRYILPKDENPHIRLALPTLSADGRRNFARD